jgi:hypothetical protein
MRSLPRGRIVTALLVLAVIAGPALLWFALFEPLVLSASGRRGRCLVVARSALAGKISKIWSHVACGRDRCDGCRQLRRRPLRLGRCDRGWAVRRRRHDRLGAGLAACASVCGCQRVGTPRATAAYVGVAPGSAGGRFTCPSHRLRNARCARSLRDIEAVRRRVKGPVVTKIAGV